MTRVSSCDPSLRAAETYCCNRQDRSSDSPDFVRQIRWSMTFCNKGTPVMCALQAPQHGVLSLQVSFLFGMPSPQHPFISDYYGGINIFHIKIGKLSQHKISPIVRMFKFLWIAWKIVSGVATLNTRYLACEPAQPGRLPCPDLHTMDIDHGQPSFASNVFVLSLI